MHVQSRACFSLRPGRCAGGRGRGWGCGSRPRARAARCRPPAVGPRGRPTVLNGRERFWKLRGRGVDFPNELEESENSILDSPALSSPCFLPLSPQTRLALPPDCRQQGVGQLLGSHLIPDTSQK